MFNVWCRLNIFEKVQICKYNRVLLIQYGGKTWWTIVHFLHYFKVPIPIIIIFDLDISIMSIIIRCLLPSNQYYQLFFIHIVKKRWDIFWLQDCYLFLRDLISKIWSILVSTIWLVKKIIRILNSRFLCVKISQNDQSYNLDQSKKILNSTATASKYTPKRPRICINWKPPFRPHFIILQKLFY